MPRSSLRAPFLACWIALAATLTARAQAPEPVPAPAPPPAAATLTLDECIARALRKNFDLQIQDYSTANAKESLAVAKAGFDPVFTVTSQRNVSQQAAATSSLNSTTTAAGPRSDTTNTRAGVTEEISATGATASVTTSLNRSSNNLANSLINPVYASDVVLSASQPLLRGAGPTVTRANIERNLLGVGIANLSFKSRVLTVVRDTENAYYNLGFTREQLIVRQHSLELAQALFNDSQTRRATGVATDLDVATAEVNVETTRRNVLLADQTVRNSEDSLLNLIGQFEFDRRPGPVQFQDYSESIHTFDLSYKLARDNFPDYLAQQEAIKQFQIDVTTAKSDKLPTLNLGGAVGYNAKDRSYGSALNHVPDGDGYNWEVDLSLTVPWGLHADKARYRVALNNLRQQESRLSQLDQTLVVAVRTAVRSVEVNIQSVAISAKATELSEKQYQLQKARFDAGLATSRQVLQAQDDLEAARVNELQAKVALRSAAAELHRLEASSLARYKIALP